MIDLRAEALLMGSGSTRVEVELVKSDLGEELGAAVKGFQIEELILDEAMNCLDFALVGVSGGRDAGVGSVTQDGGEARA